MSRVIKILVRCIQRASVECSRLVSVRIFNSERESKRGVVLRFDLQKEGSLPSFLGLFSEVGLFIEDDISFGDTADWHRLTDQISKADSRLSSEQTFKIFIAKEEFNLSSFNDALISQTVHGMPEIFILPFLPQSPRVFLGANTQPLSLPNAGTRSPPRSIDGMTVIFEEIPGARVEFVYLNEQGQLRRKFVPAADYYSEETQRRSSRFKVQTLPGFRIYGKFDEILMSGGVPFKNAIDFVLPINNSTNSAIDSHLMRQVRDIERRISVIPTRKKIYYKGAELGLEPSNEQETVIMFERYVQKNDGRLGDLAKFRLLEYSPAGIDSICEFSPNSTIPKRTVGAEFEFHLRNFFAHGHDPDQVELILCYTSNGLMFPYDHFGMTFDIDKSSALPRLVNTSTGRSTYLFILDQFVDVR